MGKKSKKQIVLICVSWLMVALIFAAVFYLSNQPADESAELSYLFTLRISRFLNIALTNFIVRKFAHATEYFFMACAVFGAMYVTFGEKKHTATFLVCFLYSVSDEIHQYFVPGRACRAFDVGVDSLGIVLGILLCLLILLIKNHKKTTEV